MIEVNLISTAILRIVSPRNSIVVRQWGEARVPIPLGIVLRRMTVDLFPERRQ